MPDAVKLRGHHLLCMLTYVGKGYTQTFIDQFDMLMGRMNAGEQVVLVEGPDDICASMHGENGPICASGEHCIKQKAAERDQVAFAAVARALKIPMNAETTLRLKAEECAHLRRLFASGDIREACTGCEWHETCTDIADRGFKDVKLMPPIY